MNFKVNPTESCILSNNSTCSGAINIVNNNISIDYTRIIVLITLMLASIYFIKRKGNRKIINIISLIVLGFIIPTCTCDFTIIQSLTSLISRNITSNVLSISIIGLIIITFTYLFGRIYCGWVCPLGIMQEIVNRYNIKLPNWLKYIKYILLFILIPLTLDKIFIAGPTANIEKYKDTTILFSTIILIIASVFIERPWCNYFCPFGALLGIVNRFAISRIVFEGKCNKCNLCGNNCKMHAIKRGKINQFECINCGDCINLCPLHSLKKR